MLCAQPFALTRFLQQRLVLAVFLEGAWAATTVQTGDGKFLADRHVSRGMACESCYAKDMKVKPSTKYSDLDVCADCHGDYTAMIKKTDGKYEPHPMVSTRRV